MTGTAGERRSIHFLGGAGILVAGQPMGGRATHRHRIALVALLIASEGRPITRDKLIAYLWPEKDTDGGRNLLKVAVHELRKEFGDAAIRTTGDQLSADMSLLECDVHDFLTAIAQGDDRAATARYAGPFLDGFFLKDAEEFEHWVNSERTRLAAAHIGVLERLAAAAEHAGTGDDALQWRRALAAEEPYRLDAAERLVHALTLHGDSAAAIQFADAFARRRRDDLGIEDDGNLLSIARAAVSRKSPPASLALDHAAPDTVSAPAAVPAANHSAGPPSVPTAAAMAPSEWWRGRRVTSALAALLVIAAAGWGIRRARRTPAESAATSGAALVAIAPFRVALADSTVGARDGLTDLLAARFAEERANGRSIDPEQAARAWRQAGASSAGISLAASLDVARSLGATELVAGEISGTLNAPEYSARLYTVSNGAVLASARVSARPPASLAGVADRIVIALTAGASQEPTDRIEGLLSRPLAAVRPYLAGEAAYRTSRYAEAEQFYAKALDADSTFALAGMQLALANSWTTISDHYGRGRDATLKYQSALSLRDRAFFKAYFGPDPALGPAKPAPEYLAAWEDVVERWPDWAEAWYQLGDRYYHYGGLSGLADPLDRARAAFRRALAQDSLLAAPLHHLVELYAARGETTELRATADRYFRANPSVSRDASAIGWETATALGDSAWIARVRANMTHMSREDLTRIDWATTENGWPAGDARRAEAILDKSATVTSEHEKALILQWGRSLSAGRSADARTAAAALGAIFPGHPVGALWDLYGSLFGGADSAQGAQAAQRLAPFANAPMGGDHVVRDQHHLAVCLTGYWRAAQHDASGAQQEMARLNSERAAEDNNFAARNARVCAAMLGAMIAVQAHRADASAKVAALDTILLRERVPPHLILEAGTIAAARLHRTLGETAAALVAARRREHMTGDPLLRSEQLLLEGQLSRLLGDSAGAARADQRRAALRDESRTPN